MPSNYLRVQIGDFEVQVEKPEDLPISINYGLEDPENFQSKTASNAINLKIPAILLNSKAANTFHDPGVEDMTADHVFTGYQSCIVEANGNELLTGKAKLSEAGHTDKPTFYNFDLYGNNGDWNIDLAESTLYDFLKHISYPFTEDAIIASWDFDGTDENLPYVLAPVRYSRPMDEYPINLVDPNSAMIEDYNMTTDYMKPAISKYFILYFAFKSLGYKIKSQFLDASYFRRQVMPWTWGSYLTSEGTILDSLRFDAQSAEPYILSHATIAGYIDAKVTNDYFNGSFDNSNTYTYDAIAKEMKWTYPLVSDHGTLSAFFSMNISAELPDSYDYLIITVRWFLNASSTPFKEEAGLIDTSGSPIYTVDSSASHSVNSGDYVRARIFVQAAVGDSKPLKITVTSFKLDYFHKDPGSTIFFNEYLGFKKYKFLDFFRGVVDEFNLSVQTDSINKIVTIEPTHPYSLTSDLSIKTGGYFNQDFIDWSTKQDVSKESVLNNFSDGERELIFKYKDDNSDGIHKKIKDRIVSDDPLGSAKFVLPERFKKGNKPVENRFFSPTMHYEAHQWKDITGIAPQMVCIIPENVSNTSKDEAQNTFIPKSCYYKGVESGVGGWKLNGFNRPDFPFMFAVNYKPGGENDPVLSYSDQRIGAEGAYTIGKGLVRRFFLQRLAIMRSGKYYNTFFRLNNTDIGNFLHQEHIVCTLQRWELVQINGYKPLKEDSTACFMRKWVAVSLADSENVYPKNETVLTNQANTSPFEIRYAPLLALPTDV